MDVFSVAANSGHVPGERAKVVFAGELALGESPRVRVSRADCELFFAFAFDDFRAKLGEADRALVDGFVSFLELLEALGVTLEVVDD